MQLLHQGKGYAGGIKRHGLKSGPSAHGSKYHRHAGSNGMASDLAKYSKERKCQDKWEQKELLFRILKS